MKKIMFNDKYGLTDAVLRGRKTMTRRIIPLTDTDRECLNTAFDRDLRERVIIDRYAKYKVGEVVAVAQRYKEVVYEPHTVCECLADEKYSINLKYEKGWNNKMYVKAAYMPHRIRIIGIKVEKLQDISDEDCFKEGIIPITWRQHLQQDLNDLSPQKYIEHNVYTLEKFREGIENCWAESNPNEYMAEEAKVAFAVLIFKMLGRKVWEQNPYVFAYTFKLID